MDFFVILLAMTTGTPDQDVSSQSVDDTDVLVQTPAKVILYNDEAHTFDEVIGQIIKATGYDRTKAEALTWEVHNTGRAMVFEGEMRNCMKVSAVLEEIDLTTRIEV